MAAYAAPDPTAAAAATDFEVRCRAQLGRGRVQLPDAAAPDRQRRNLLAVWNNRGDLAGARFHYETPREAAAAQRRGPRPRKTFADTQQHFVWNTEGGGTTGPASPTAGGCERRHLTPEKHHSRQSTAERGVQNAFGGIRRIASVQNNASPGVRRLLVDPTEGGLAAAVSAAPVRPPTNTAGRLRVKHGTLDAIARRRDQTLIAAEQNRIRRVGKAKANFYQSNAADYFGFESGTPQPDRAQGKSSRHTPGRR